MYRRSSLFPPTFAFLSPRSNCSFKSKHSHGGLDGRSSRAQDEFRRTRCRSPEVVTVHKIEKIGICRSRLWRCLENTHTSTSSSFFCASKSMVCRYLQKRLKKGNCRDATYSTGSSRGQNTESALDAGDGEVTETSLYGPRTDRSRASCRVMSLARQHTAVAASVKLRIRSEFIPSVDIVN